MKYFFSPLSWKYLFWKTIKQVLLNSILKVKSEVETWCKEANPSCSLNRPFCPIFDLTVSTRLHSAYGDKQTLVKGPWAQDYVTT